MTTVEFEYGIGAKVTLPNGCNGEIIGLYVAEGGSKRYEVQFYINDGNIKEMWFDE